MGKLAYLSIIKIRVSLNKRAKPVPKKIFSFGASKACCSLLSPLPLSWAFFTLSVSPPIVQTNPLAAPTPQRSPPAPPARLQQHKSYPHGESYSIGGQRQSSSDRK